LTHNTKVDISVTGGWKREVMRMQREREREREREDGEGADKSLKKGKLIQ